MSLLIVIAAVLALIWGAVFVLRGSTVAGCLLFLLSGCCFGHHWLNFDLGPLPLTIDRLVLGLVLGTYLIQRRLGQADPKPIRLVDALLLAFVGLLTTSTMLTDDPWHGTPFDPVPPVWRLAGAYLFPLAIYWTMRQSSVGRRQTRWVDASLIGFGVYLAITAVLEVNQAWH